MKTVGELPAIYQLHGLVDRFVGFEDPVKPVDVLMVQFSHGFDFTKEGSPPQLVLVEKALLDALEGHSSVIKQKGCHINRCECALPYLDRFLKKFEKPVVRHLRDELMPPLPQGELLLVEKLSFMPTINDLESDHRRSHVRFVPEIHLELRLVGVWHAPLGFPFNLNGKEITS